MTDFVLTTAAGDAVREKYRREGVAQERERIIKLLEEQGCDCHNVYCDKLPTYAAQHLIALIKGESVQEPAVSTNDGQGSVGQRCLNWCHGRR